MYRKIYKCRMCGEIIAQSAPINRILIDSELSQIISQKFEKLYCIHNCKNGDVGVAELQGIKK